MNVPQYQFIPTYNTISKKYEIDLCHNENICELAKYYIYFILDDSGSMNSRTENGTRWKELHIMVQKLTEICNSINQYGVNISFLNKSETYNITNYNDIYTLLSFDPCGSTPTCERLQTILNIPSNLPKLIVLFTDGCPDGGNVGLTNFYNLLKTRDAEKNRITIIACTDNDQDVEFLNRLDKEIQYIDVVDDYKSEKLEILKKQGSSFPFSYGDYLIKSLLSTINPIYDNFDEKKIEIIEDQYGNRKMQYCYNNHSNDSCIIL